MYRLTLFLALFFVSYPGVSNERVFASGFEELNWQLEAGEYEVGSNKAIIRTNSHQSMLLGADAAQYMFLSEGHYNFNPDAIVLTSHSDGSTTLALYQNHAIGYISMDDWEEQVKPNELMKVIKKNAAKTNKERTAGHENLHIDGWAQEPVLDRRNAIIYWAIHAHTDSGHKVVNVKTLKLGRDGFTEMIWVGLPEQFTSAEKILKPVANIYQYADGSKYVDYVEGDTLAAMGAGALLYKLTTGKTAVNTGVIATLILIAKKFWYLLLIPVAYVWKRLQKRN